MLAAMLVLAVLLSGCTSYSTIINKPRAATTVNQAYSIGSAVSASRSGELTLVLAFSGAAPAPQPLPTGCWPNCAIPAS